jgi:hypothetical protein
MFSIHLLPFRFPTWTLRLAILDCVGELGSKSEIANLEFHSPQPQRVGYDKNTAKGHRRRGQNRV